MTSKMKCVIAKIETMPGAVSVVHGEWKPFDLKWGRSIWYCTACEEGVEVPCDIWTHKPIYNYCPNCGAKMDGDRKTEPNLSEIPTSKIIEAYAKGWTDGAEAVKAMPQTETEIVLDPSFADLSDEQFVEAMKLIEPQTNADQRIQRIEYVGNDGRCRCWKCKHFEEMHETPISSDGRYYTYVVCTASKCHYEPKDEPQTERSE